MATPSDPAPRRPRGFAAAAPPPPGPSGALARALARALPAVLTAALAASLAACSTAPHGAAASASPHPASTPASPPGAASRPVSAAALRATCGQVSAVLAGGPDPAADPVGHAEAQMLPLSQIRTSDPRLRAAISGLAGAYRAFFASNGMSGAAKVAVAQASKRIDSFCPGAAS